VRILDHLDRRRKEIIADLAVDRLEAVVCTVESLFLLWFWDVVHALECRDMLHEGHVTVSIVRGNPPTAKMQRLELKKSGKRKKLGSEEEACGLVVLRSLVGPSARSKLLDMRSLGRSTRCSR
jgi:hypothetical protein